MKFGLFDMNKDLCSDPDVAVTVGKAAEEAGFESLWAPEHIVLPDPPIDRFPVDPMHPWIEPLTMLTFLAAHTSTINLGTGVVVLPQRNPFVLAKTLASVDELSQGRLLFGLGVGHLQPEMEALGVPFHERGRISDEFIETMRSLWRDQAPAFQGKHVSFSGVQARPQRDVHLVIGGHTKPAFRRSVRYGHGWDPMPDPDALDPHTGEFDAAGRFWFTLQRSNKVGRLQPDTGEIELVDLDRPRSRPYGIKIAANGDAWVACNGGPCLYRFDADSMAAMRIDLPNQETHVRRLDIADDGTIWYVNSGAGRLGQYDPATGKIREWPSPSGPNSHPYALLIVDGAIWYNESGMRPDALVRFDPGSETFQSWPIPSSGVYSGILRHMRAARNGDLLIHQSATNHIMRVSVSQRASD